MKQESSRRVCCTPLTALVQMQPLRTGSSAALRGPPCRVSAAGLSLERWALYSASSQSGAWDVRVAGLRRLVLVLKQDARLRTPNTPGWPFAALYLVPVTQAWKPNQLPSPPLKPQRGGYPLLPAFQKRGRGAGITARRWTDALAVEIPDPHRPRSVLLAAGSDLSMLTSDRSIIS